MTRLDMDAMPKTHNFNVRKLPQGGHHGARNTSWGHILDELLRLFARGQNEGLGFTETTHKRSSLRSAMETELIHRGISDKYGVQCFAEPGRSGEYVIAITTSHTVPSSRRTLLTRKRKTRASLSLQLPVAHESVPGLRAIVEDVIAQLSKK